MKAWYDGYHFGDFDVYCPWDVMNYVFDLQNNPKAKPASYWKNTSDNAIIRSFIDYAGNSITKKLEALLAGKYIVQRIDESLTYDYLLNRSILKDFYATFKAADASLRFVLLTGVTKFSQITVFSGFNQPNDISMDSKYDAICGITEAELHTVFADSIAAMAKKFGLYSC